jgi:hypothetical protein
MFIAILFVIAKKLEMGCGYSSVEKRVLSILEALGLITSIPPQKQKSTANGPDFF